VTAWQLNLLHVNDIHVRMEETNKYSASCKPWEKEAGKCYGGLARMYSAVKEIKEREENVLWLNAGDFFQGTIWYSQFKWRAASQFNNLMEFDAMTLGNHEFDDKIEGIVPFLANQSCAVVVSNLNHSQVPELQGLYSKSIIVDISGHSIGLVGYITPETAYIADPENLIFLDEVEALTAEVSNLKEQGIKTIIAIGHSGYVRDMEIARTVPDIDVIVGGHSHSFLFSPNDSSPSPSIEPVRGPYPTLVEHPSTTPTLVLQAYAFTKYLGHMKLQFDDNGGLTSWSGQPILLDSKFKKNPRIEAALDPWRLQLSELTEKVVGSSAQLMLKERDVESALGNWITDTMVFAWRDRTVPGGGKVRQAITNTGSMRGSVETGNITLADIMAIFPFQNSWDLVTMLGSKLRLVFEHSVERMNSKGHNGGGQFLQMSGFKVTYDVRKNSGSRVVKLEVLEEDGVYRRMEDNKAYSFVTTDFLTGGGDGYRIEEFLVRDKIIGFLDTEVIQTVLQRDSPIVSQIDGRITIITDDNNYIVTSERDGSEQSSKSASIEGDYIHIALVSISLVTLFLDI